MNGLSEFNQNTLRSVRNIAILEGFGYIQYRFISAKLQNGQSILRPPRYAWHFVPHSTLVPITPVYRLSKPMSITLQEVLSTQKSNYLEGWGLLRYTNGSIEFTPDFGPLSEDHPHAGWTVIKATLPGLRTQEAKGRVRFKGSSSYHKPVQLISLVMFFMLMLSMRFGLMVDGTDSTLVSKWSEAGLPMPWPEIQSAYTPSIISTVSLPEFKTFKGRGVSPLEHGEDAGAEEQIPLSLVVLGLYSNQESAIQNSSYYKQQGYETLVFTRKVFAGRELFAIAIPYRGFEPLVYLKEIQSKLIPHAWLLESDAMPSAFVTS